METHANFLLVSMCSNDNWERVSQGKCTNITNFEAWQDGVVFQTSQLHDERHHSFILPLKDEPGHDHGVGCGLQEEVEEDSKARDRTSSEPEIETEKKKQPEEHTYFTQTAWPPLH